MVCAGESLSPGQGRNNNGLEIGCLVDAASGLLTFTANGKELGTYYQVSIFLGCIVARRGKTESLTCSIGGFSTRLQRKSNHHCYGSNFSLCLIQVEPSTKLFPAVFAQATSPNVFQFELGRIKVNNSGFCAGLGLTNHTK